MATISNVNGKKITKIKYKGEIYDTGGSSEDRLKKLLDATKSCYHLFYNYKGESVNDLISYSDTSSVTTISNMFEDCTNLFTIPQLNTSNVTNMSNMFYNCRHLTTIPQLNTSNVTNMTYMFRGCYSLTTIPQLNTSNVTNMSNMFYSCSNLKTIDITHMKTTSTSSASYFAAGCYSLTKFIIRNMTTIPVINTNSFESCFHFTGTIDSSYNPNGLKDGRIYVPDDKVEELKTATNWSVYADIIVPLSTLVE